MRDRPHEDPGGLLARRGTKSTGSPKKTGLSASGWDGIEVVPDSEEDRSDVIEISSSSDEDEEPPNLKSDLFADADPFVPGAWPGELGGLPLEPQPVRPPISVATPPKSSKKTSTRSRAVDSSSPGGSGRYKVVPGSSPTSTTPKSKVPLAKALYDTSGSTTHAPPKKRKPLTSRTAPRVIQSIGDSDDEVFSRPSPTRTMPNSKRQPLFDDDSDTSDIEGHTSKSVHPSPKLARPSGSSGNTPGKVANRSSSTQRDDSPASRTPSRVKTRTPSMPSPIKSPTKQKRLTKKAQQLAERIQREEYAKEVYVDLNSRVFENGLPSLTAVDIIWNPRMTATAGQAKYHMNRNGVESATIQLATKILDCDERIRNTLSHEMCHLACWMIDRNTDEAHGKLFKAWARKVEDEDPDITVSVTHNYAIYYPFTWECVDCKETVGRFSNSIDTEKFFCPNACKSGKMLPLFDAPKRIPRLSKISKMAAARPRNSPRRRLSPISISSSSDEEETPSETPSEIPSAYPENKVIVVHGSDSESDGEGANRTIEDLISTLGGITITHSA